MKIDIWSDIVCPFCYIGRTHLEKAIEAFEHGEDLRRDLQIVWHSFELDPTYAKGNATPLVELVAKKYGVTPEQAARQHEAMHAQAAAVGLDFRWEQARYGNTFDAHRVGHLAARAGRDIADAYELRLMKAYFTDGLLVEDPAVIRELAVEVGLAEADVRRVLESDEFAAEVRADEEAARRLGITGVPFFVFDEKYAVSGAQPVEVFVRALNTAWEESRPAPFRMVTGDETSTDTAPHDEPHEGAVPEGAVCGPDGCEIPSASPDSTAAGAR
ncbi:DsbA family oxidoreductase [Mobilicoccus sp.]|uniref:DsbA family oxidoreductase n=1 Tax=Mobilicoccus sp. TaxID=2034349 RepID=UPI0028B16E96|nr:DsbA family oxidoreductase [Mobilicoccus sp.]